MLIIRVLRKSRILKAQFLFSIIKSFEVGQANLILHLSPILLFRNNKVNNSPLNAKIYKSA